MSAPDPRRKFALLVALNKHLGVDVSRRELSVAALEEIAARHGIEVPQQPTTRRAWR